MAPDTRCDAREAPAGRATDGPEEVNPDLARLRFRAVFCGTLLMSFGLIGAALALRDAEVWIAPLLLGLVLPLPAAWISLDLRRGASVR
jgi:hypothetical protein